MRTRLLLGLAAVAAIAVGSVLGALVVRSSERDAFERGQREQVQRAARQAEALTALSVGQLAGAAAFFQTQDDVTRREFKVIADSLLDTGAPAGTAFIERVERSERAAFERDRVPITEGRRLGELGAAAERDRYFPLSFTESKVDVGIEAPIGYDLGSDPVRRSYMLRARDRGEPTATHVIPLLVGGTGINVFRPVYRDGAATRTVAQRRAALIGFATGAFRINDVARAATAALPPGVDAQLVERGRSVAGPELPRDEAASAPVRIADRSWLLVVRNPDRPGITLPLLMAVLGISMAALLGALVVIWSRNERMQELQRQASHDPLTGLKNRRRFGEDLRTELARSRREGTEGALLMLDLDNFKQVNDSLGHPIGDRVIGEIAGVLKGRTRETDVLARLGGDEFAIVLPHCDLGEARGVAEAISRAIREHVPSEEGVPPITASIGVAMFGPDARNDFDSLLVEADAAMYAAKQAGRDSVSLAGARAESAAGDGSRG
ncbi:MAG TPA: diguanylate cyclase [Solirubrobacterales bacterium]